MTSHIQSWLWSGVDGTNRVTVSEGGSPDTITLSGGMNLTDAMADLETQLNASGTLADSYAVTVDPVAETVTVSSSGTFRIQFRESLWQLVGFAEAATGFASSHSSVTSPLGLLAVAGVTYTPPRVMETVDHRDYRYGRGASFAYWQGETVTLQVYAETTRIDALLAGPMFSGAITVTPDSTEATGFSSDQTNGVMHLCPRGISNVETFGVGDSHRRVTLDCVRMQSVPTVPASGFARLASGLPYGWRMMYAAKVEGIEYLFTEADTGASAPTGYTVDPSLVIDGSSQVGSRVSRERGVGVGFDLIFRLTRTSVVVGLMQRPTFLCRLTAGAAGTDTTITVDDTTGLTGTPPGVSLYMGVENIGACYAASGTSIAGLDRGTPNAEWPAYDVDVSSAVGTWVTDRPMFWRGRRVELYAVPVDPFGAVHGANVLSDATMVWRGRVSSDVRPDHDGFVFAAQSEDRRLERDLATGQSARGILALGDDRLVDVDPEVVLSLFYFNTFDVITPGGDSTELTPFAGLSGQLYLSEVRQIIADSVNAWFASQSYTYIKEAQWIETTDTKSYGGFGRYWQFAVQCSNAFGNPDYFTRLEVTKVAGKMDYTNHKFNFGGKPATTGPDAGFLAPEYPDFGLRGLNSFRTWTYNVNLDGFSVEMDSADPSSLPTSGAILVSIGDEEAFYRYTDRTVSGSRAVLKIDPNSGPPLSTLAEIDTVEKLSEDFGVKFLFDDEGLAADVMRRMLLSSGRGDNDATYDVNSLGYGYDVRAVDTASFDEALDGAWRLMEGDFRLHTDVSFSSVFGGLLGLSGRCVVPRESADGSDIELACVRTTLYDTAEYTVSITDEHVVAGTTGQEPVRFVDRDTMPNAVRVDGEHAGNTFNVIVNDVQAQVAEGQTSLDIKTRGFRRTLMAGSYGSPGPVVTWARSMFADRFGAIPYEIDVVPWLPVQVGDAVHLDLSHYALWDRATGAQGYTGVGRVVGRRVDLGSCVQTLTVYIQGSYSAGSLCPSAEVLSFTGTAAAPVTINVPLKYLGVFTAHLEGGNLLGISGGVPFYLRPYTRGGAQYGGVYINAVAESGGECVLTVDTWFTGTLTVGDYLATPQTGTSNPRQEMHMHTDTDGGVWQ
jgi:hypothetical protein